MQIQPAILPPGHRCFGAVAEEEEVRATCLTSAGWVWRLVLGSLGWGDGNGARAEVAGARGA